MVGEYKYFRRINDWNTRKKNNHIFVKVKNPKTIAWYKSLGWSEISCDKYLARSEK